MIKTLIILPFFIGTYIALLLMEAGYDVYCILNQANNRIKYELYEL
jgi:hypothetical protein